MRNVVGTPVSPELARDAERLVEELRSGYEIEPERIVGVVYGLTEESLRCQFIRPTEAFGLGMRLRKMIEFAVNTSLKGMRYGLDHVIPKLDDAQRRQLADFLDEALYEGGD